MHNFIILQELQISINKLGERVAPWLKIRLSGDPSMTQIISAVDKIVYDDGIIREKVMQTSLRGYGHSVNQQPKWLMIWIPK